MLNRFYYHGYYLAVFVTYNTNIIYLYAQIVIGQAYAYNNVHNNQG